LDRLWKSVGNILVGIAALERRFRNARSGSVAITIGLTLPIVIGMAALGSEITYLLYKHRQMQVVADAAAFGGATALQRGYPAAGVEARGVSGFLGFVDGASGATVTVNNPPLSGSQINNTAAVEVIVGQPQTLVMVTLFRSGLFNLSARAVATAGSGTYCVLQLNGANGTGVTMNNGATPNLTQCGMAVDATGPAALSLTGAAILTATSVSVVGTASISNGAAINPSSALKTSQQNVADPYAGVTMPALPSGCSLGTGQNYKHSNSGLQTVNPGVWCSGVSFTNDANVLLNPGIYYVDRGNFNVGGAVTLNGTGVTIVLTSSTGNNYANATIGNGATVTLSAPTTGATAGLVLFGDRRAPISNTSDLEGGAAIIVSGALYLPSQNMIFQNGASNPSGCTQLIAGTIQLKGGSKFQNNCPTGVAAIGAANSALVE
jgi:hypothetical protein